MASCPHGREFGLCGNRHRGALRTKKYGMLNDELKTIAFPFIVPRSSLIEEGDFAVNDAREVSAVAHDPCDAVAAARELGPLARLLRVLLDEYRAFRQLDVAKARTREATHAAPAAEELLDGDEYHARFGHVARLRH